MNPARTSAGIILALLIQAVLANGMDLQSMVECTPPGPAAYCIIGEPSISPDGQCLAYTGGTTWPPYYEYWPGIQFSRLDAGGCESYSPAGPSPGANWSFNPAWSPDGTHIAFVSEGWDAETCGLWTLDLRDPESPNALRHLSGPEAREPAWSPDGSSIAYAGTGGLYIVPSAGGAPTLWVADASFPSWGPEGQIVFVRHFDLWIRETDGTERQLTDTPDYETEPAWSPRGGWIAYASNHSGNWDLWIIATSGATPVQLTSSPAQEGSPSWSAAADRLVFSSTLNEQDSIWLATDLPDWTTALFQRTWSAMKQLYR